MLLIQWIFLKNQQALARKKQCMREPKILKGNKRRRKKIKFLFKI